MLITIPCTRLDPQCRKIHDLGPRIWPPLPTGGHRVKWKDTCVFDWAHSPGAMIWGPIEYKDKDTKTQFLPETKSL